MNSFTQLERGVFTISLDFELAWGMLDLYGPNKHQQLYATERHEVIDRLLDLFVEFDISATWCIVGHLFLDSCFPVGDVKHPEIVRPEHRWHDDDWFVHDPCSSTATAPAFYGRDLIERIRNCKVPQEIGSHSFSHMIFGDEGCSLEAARSELQACVLAAKQMGIDMGSFVFPRNSVGHLDAVREAGFECYRGVEPNWFEDASCPPALRRAMRLVEVVAATTPPVVLPERESNGLWNIRGSAMYFPMHGLRRFIPVGRRVKRAIKGIDAAVREKKIFHLWFHPTNMAEETDKMFSGLRAILSYADEPRRSGDLAIMPMKLLVKAVSANHPGAQIVRRNGAKNPESASLGG